MTFLSLLVLNKLNCPLNIFSALTAMYHQMGDIGILEVIRWAWPKKGLETLPQRQHFPS